MVSRIFGLRMLNQRIISSLEFFLTQIMKQSSRYLFHEYFGYSLVSFHPLYFSIFYFGIFGQKIHLQQMIEHIALSFAAFTVFM